MSCNYDAFVSALGFALIFFDCVVFKLAMHSLTSASRPRLSETEPTWLVSAMRSVGESVASQK